MHNQTLPESPTEEPSNALVSMEPSGAAPSGAGDPFLQDGPSRRHRVSPLAGFVTQLIACRRRLPEYRARRLAESGEATQRYHAVEHPPRRVRNSFERLF